jgi:N-acetyl sugar amidotransferase
MINIFWCKTCLNTSTRPRITFDKNGSCNACQWSNEKKKINWLNRQSDLNILLNKHKKNDQRYDCIVPVSGGKDGTYVYDQLKNKYHLNPLCVTIKPNLELEIGKKNLENFLSKGVDHIHINTNIKTIALLDKIGFTEYGQGYYGWMIAMHSAPILIAKLMNINLVFYAEDGEVEYGGTTKYKYNPIYTIDHQKKIFLNSTYNDVLKKSGLKNKDLYWLKFPEDKKKKIHITHYSYFEDWNPYRNYMIAKEKYDLQDMPNNNDGTFTNFAHNDQALSSLHYYLMYIKFGFGRATQDAGIEIRRGAMTRDQAKNLIELYDGIFPDGHLKDYLFYFNMTEGEFFENIDKLANKDLFKKTNRGWKPKFKII